jgi:hypothetical protein
MSTFLHHKPSEQLILLVNIILASLLFVWGPRPKTVGNAKGGQIVHIATGHLIASESDRVPKPFARHPDGHLQPKASLGMEKGAGVLVLSKVLDELRILFRELIHMLAETDTGRIHYGKIRPKGLEKLNRAGFKGGHSRRKEREM